MANFKLHSHLLIQHVDCSLVISPQDNFLNFPEDVDLSLICKYCLEYLCNCFTFSPLFG